MASMRKFIVETKPLWMPSTATAPPPPSSEDAARALERQRATALSRSRTPSTTESSASSQRGVRRRLAPLEKDYVIKILVLGGAGVGKSAIVRRFAGRPFDRREKPTIGIETSLVDYGTLQDRKVRLVRHYYYFFS